jgi:hypothetical protein
MFAYRYAPAAYLFIVYLFFPVMRPVFDPMRIRSVDAGRVSARIWLSARSAVLRRYICRLLFTNFKPYLPHNFQDV